MILKIIVILIVGGAGVLAGSYLIGQPIIDIQSNAQNLWQFAQEHWLKLATASGGIITGVGYIVSKVIGRKNEAINTLGQTVIQKDRDITYLETQLHSEGTIKAFKEKYGEDAFTKIETLSTDLTKTKATLETKMTEIANWEEKETRWNDTRSRLEDERNYLANRIKSLEYDLAVEKGEIKLPVK